MPRAASSAVPAGSRELVAVAGDDRAGVSAVVEAFRAPGRNFLTANPPDRLDDDSEIDVSHEALIRRWRQLSDPTRDAEQNEPAGWMWREFEDGQRWRALAVQARMFRNDRSKSATLSPATTEAYAAWWPEHTPAWAARYARDRELAAEEYQEVSDLWHASQKALELERTRLERELDEQKARSDQLLRVQRFMTLTAALVALIMAVAGVSSWILRQRATREGQRADAELDKALRTQSLFLAEVARQERAEGDAGTAILLALEALPGFRRRRASSVRDRGRAAARRRGAQHARAGGSPGPRQVRSRRGVQPRRQAHRHRVR